MIFPPAAEVARTFWPDARAQPRTGSLRISGNEDQPTVFGAVKANQTSAIQTAMAMAPIVDIAISTAGRARGNVVNEAAPQPKAIQAMGTGMYLRARTERPSSPRMTVAIRQHG